MSGKSVLLIICIGFGFAVPASTAYPQSAANAGRNVLDRVYTEAQAARGAAQYEANCMGCHEGNDPDGPTLLSDFIERWREDNLATLFTFMKTNMPRDEPGKLSDNAYVDILSYILQINDYAAGSSELNTGDLASVQLVGKSGPQPLPNNALVRVVGCLTPAAEAWTLTNAPAPSRIRRAEEATAEELKQSAAIGPGTQAFRLQNLQNAAGANPESHKGHKMQAKGVLSRLGKAERINVVILEMLAPDCGP